MAEKYPKKLEKEDAEHYKHYQAVVRNYENRERAKEEAKNRVKYKETYTITETPYGTVTSVSFTKK